MAGFAFALALDANEIHVEMHIESLSRYKEYLLTTILYQSSSSSHVTCHAKRYYPTRSSILSFGAQNDPNSIKIWNPKFHTHTTIING